MLPEFLHESIESVESSHRDYEEYRELFATNAMAFDYLKALNESCPKKVHSPPQRLCIQKPFGVQLIVCVCDSRRTMCSERNITTQ